MKVKSLEKILSEGHTFEPYDGSLRPMWAGLGLKKLRAIQPEDFKRSFCQLKRRWQKCIDVKGEYFEGDKSNLPKL